MKISSGIRERKVERVTEFLRNALLPLPAGGKLPSVRAVMKKTGAGRLAVSHALDALRREGLIRIDSRRGIYRIKKTEQSDEIRLIHFQKCVLESSSFMGALFRKLQERAGESGRRIVVENVDFRTPEETVRELTAHGVSRCIVSGAAQPDFARFLKRHIPICLELLPRHGEPVVPALRDSPQMTAIQMNYLLKLGYRRIGYVHYGGFNTYLYPIHTLRLLDYYRIMAENALPVNPDWVFHCSENYENLASGMDRIFHSDPPPEALIVPGRAIRQLYSWCRKLGIRIGVDLALFSSDDVSASLKPEATTVTNSPESIAETFWAMFQAAERGEEVESRCTELFIRTGRTVPSRSVPS